VSDMIPIAHPLLGAEELQNVKEAVESGWISSKGRFITEFEDEFAEYCGVKYGIATSNGTTALHLALKGLGIGKGDEVIVPDLTFIATANAVTYTGATPVMVDSHPVYWGLDPEKIEENITPKTKAIIPVHLYGHPCDMDAINDIAGAHNLYVVEDAAEAHGAEYKGRKVGGFGDVACFSFFGNKIITTGEGGMCLTNDEELAANLRILRDHGQRPDKKYWYDMVGFNYRMTNVQAAIGVAQVERLGQLIGQKRQVAGWYAEGLKCLSDEGVIVPASEMPWAKNVYWMYSILLNQKFGIGRDEVISGLYDMGIETRPFFYPLHVMPPYEIRTCFPVAETISRWGINLPSGYDIGEADVSFICRSIESIYGGNA
jgi:perosamine synthetase